MDNEIQPEISPVQSSSSIITPNPNLVPPTPQILEPPKQKSRMVLGLVILLILSLGTTIYFSYQNYQFKNALRIVNSKPFPTEEKLIPAPECIDSDDQCRQKPDDTYCNTGVWCDKTGMICGGESCVGMGIGKCLNEKCIAEKTTTGSTADWKTYTNTIMNFSINYPTGWRKIEGAELVGFGPQEIGEDVTWVVSLYNKSETTEAQIKDDFGKQFDDRKQTEEKISINGLSATKIITTTNEFANWYSVQIIIDNGDMLYVISNGAMTDKTLNEEITKRAGKSSDISFEDFYSSFRIIK